MILAAGLGTRLQPYTIDRPKALVEVGGKPLIAHVLEKLAQSGFTDIIVNVHHFADMVEGFLSENNFGCQITVSDERNRLLNTGGGILKAKSFLDGEEPFLVHNVDILSDIDLREMVAVHSQSNALATLAVGERESSRHFLFDEQMRLTGWRNNLTGKEIIPAKERGNLKAFAFNGIHVISPRIFELIHASGPFSVVDAYLNLCRNHLLLGYNATGKFVVDVGKPKNLEKAIAFAKSQKV